MLISLGEQSGKLEIPKKDLENAWKTQAESNSTITEM